MAARLIKSKAPQRNLLGSREQLSMDPVEVFCRVKPLNDPNVETCVTALDNQTLQMVEPVNQNKPMTSSQEDESIKVTQAKFTHLFDSDSTQEEVFNRVAFSLCDDLIQGKNGLLFTYGITGSGKTYTMTGSKTEPGILHRCFDVVFNTISAFQADPMVFVPDKMNKFDVRSKVIASLERARQNLCPVSANTRKRRQVKRNFIDWDPNGRYNNEKVTKIPLSKFDEDYAFAIFVSYVEIYNDYIYDLLENSNDQKSTSKKVREDLNRFMYVSGATEREVRSTQEAIDAFEEGRKNRHQASTVLNAESSRSHSVFTIKLVKAPLDDSATEVLQDKNKVCVSQLSLVDLAGSERSSRTGNCGSRLVETGNINTSLMFLRECLKALREKQRGNKKTVVSYRSCTLTNLFKNYFDGEGKVSMIVCINPSAADYDENLDVLSFSEVTKDLRVAPSAVTNWQLEGLTPGRRRAAQIIKEVKAEMEREFQHSQNVVVAPKSSPDLPAKPTFYDLPLKPFSEVAIRPENSYNDEMFAKMKKFFKAKTNWWADVWVVKSTKESAFEEGLRKYVFDGECLRKRHEDCERFIRETDRENQQLKSENIRLKQTANATDSRLKKYENDSRFYANQQEAIRKGETKLRAVKEIVSRPQISAVKKRAPSPPPKPYRHKDMSCYNLRRHRRSQSISDLTDENIPPTFSADVPAKSYMQRSQITPFCPGKGRRFKNEVTSSSDTASEGPVKRRSDETNGASQYTTKRGREN